MLHFVNNAAMSDSDKQLSQKLKYAVKAGDEKAVRRLLKGGVMANSSLHITWFDTTLLHEAVTMGNTGIVQLLLKNGANVNQSSQDGRTALHIACRSGNKGMVDILLQSNSNVNKQTQDGRSPLHIAAWKAHRNIGRDLILAGASCNLRDDDHWTPLHWAAKFGTTDLVKCLLENGANVIAEDRHGVTPLLIGLNHPSSLKLLIKHGAPLASKTKKDTLFRMLHNPHSNNFASMKILLCAGYPLHSDHWAVRNIELIRKRCSAKLDEENCSTMLCLLSTRLTSVPALTELCRSLIRARYCQHYKGRHVYKALCDLSLPSIIIDFLTMKPELESVDV